MYTNVPGLALVYFLSRCVDYSPSWNSGDSLVRLFVIADLLTSTLPFALSAVYHTFMPHVSGEQVYYRLLKTDVFGVWFAATFGSLSGIYVTLYCFSTFLYVYIVGFLLLSLVVLYYLVLVDCKRKRVAALSVQLFFRSLVLFLRLTHPVAVPLAAFKFYFVTNIISSIGALINALHVPERWFPGRCDYLVNGHSLMHVAAVLSLVVGRNGLLMDLNWLASVPSCPAL